MRLAAARRRTKGAFPATCTVVARGLRTCELDAVLREGAVRGEAAGGVIELAAGERGGEGPGDGPGGQLAQSWDLRLRRSRRWQRPLQLASWVSTKAALVSGVSTTCVHMNALPRAIGVARPGHGDAFKRLNMRNYYVNSYAKQRHDEELGGRHRRTRRHGRSRCRRAHAGGGAVWRDEPRDDGQRVRWRLGNLVVAVPPSAVLEEDRTSPIQACGRGFESTERGKGTPVRAVEQGPLSPYRRHDCMDLNKSRA
jgi:hypothetical protein